VAKPAERGQTYELECPHCHKTFSAEVMLGDAERHTGFKCPHCRLFVAYERSADTPE
jgi:transposase-like protein